MTPIIDCRDLKDYKKGHIKGATHIPFSILENSWHELPPKGAKLDLCCYDEQRQELEQLFTRQQYDLQHIFIEQDLNPKILEIGTQSKRLWKANPILEKHLGIILKHTTQSNPLALDIGCGSGRDSILLAKNGFKVIAIDNKQYALDKLDSFAEKSQVAVKTQNLDCEKNLQNLIEMIKKENPTLIMQSRYLHRPLLDIYKEHLPKGAIVAIHTFLEGAAKFGSPKNPAFLLKNNELAKVYQNWDMLLDELHTIEDGRPLSLFLAQKKEQK